MKRYLLLLCFLLTSCSAPPPTPLLTAPSNTPIPSPAPTLIPPTETPVQLVLSVTDERINCRYGPGVVYAFVNELGQGQSARVIGRNSDSSWWYIKDPGNPDGKCWVSAQVTQIAGDAARLPVVNPPFVEVTNLDLRIEPERIFIPCSQFPQNIFFESNLTANGPTVAVWRLESSTGYVSAENQVTFVEAGIQTVNGYYSVPIAGDYWINLHVLKPNDVSVQLAFPANCSSQ